MTGNQYLSPPNPPPADVNGAYRVIDEFNQKYGDDLLSAQHYLDRLVTTTALEFAEGYRPWLKALKDFIQGVHLLAKKIPLPDPKRFKEALSVFSLESTINFVFDLCAAARRTMEKDWAENFRKHVIEVMAAIQIVAARQKQGVEFSR